MRELSACKAEVFRRSEERIKQRKRNRSRMIACCVPLLLCFAVCSVMILPAMMPAKNANDTPAEEIADEKTNGSYVCSYMEVTVRNLNGTDTDTKKITDKAQVTKVFTAIHSLYDSLYPYSNGAGDVLQEGNENMQAGESEDPLTGLTSKLTGCVITFRTEDGAETVYTLDNNEIRKVDENIKITLTDTQAAELKEILGIAE